MRRPSASSCRAAAGRGQERDVQSPPRQAAPRSSLRRRPLPTTKVRIARSSFDAGVPGNVQPWASRAAGRVLIGNCKQAAQTPTAIMLAHPSA